MCASAVCSELILAVRAVEELKFFLLRGGLFGNTEGTIEHGGGREGENATFWRMTDELAMNLR